MVDTRRNELLPTAERLVDDDYLFLDGATEGIRKFPARNFLQELGARINVANEGAVGDGTTNNAPVFARLFAMPGSYFVPAGRYIVRLRGDFSDLIFVTSNVNILFDPEAILEFHTPGVPGLVLFEASSVTIIGGILEFAGKYAHSEPENYLMAGETLVRSMQSALLKRLGIAEVNYNIDIDCTASTISIFGGSKIELNAILFRGKTRATPQLAAISISPNSLYKAADDIRILRPHIDDVTFGIISGRGVRKLRIENPYFGRFITLGVSPSHAIYCSANKTCPPNEDVTIIGAYDSGEMIGDRDDGPTASIKIRKGLNVLIADTFSRRPAGLFDIAGVQNGLFLGGLYVPRQLQKGTYHYAIRCYNAPSVYAELNRNVRFTQMQIVLLDVNNEAVGFEGLVGSDEIHIEATIYRPGATARNKPIVMIYGADTGAFDINYYGDVAHRSSESWAVVLANAKDVRGKVHCNFEPRITLQSGAVAAIEVNGRPTLLPLANAPTFPVPGQIARANRTNWDPLGKGSGGSYLVMRSDLNDAWIAIDGKA